MTSHRDIQENCALFNHGFWGFILANIASAKKRAKQAEQNRIRNASAKSRLRTFIKKVVNAIAAGDVEKAREAFREAVPVIDSSAGKGLIHKNKAARSKSRLSAKIKALSLSKAA